MLRTLLGAILFLIAPALAFAEPPVTTFKLKNGMDVVVIEDHRAPVVTHMVWYRVGSADERPGVSGIAHFLEHLMFKGTDEIADGAFSKIIAANGGQDNAFTSWDYTAYFQRIASDRLELVMKMESDRMVDVAITEAHIKTERQVVIEERNMRTDNSPDAQFNEQMRAALYMNHRYGVPIVGWKHELETLTLKDALTFYKRYYAPDNAILIVAGDVTPARVLELAKKYYGPIKPSNHPPDPRPQEPPQLAARRIEMQDKRVRQPYVMRSYLVPTYDPKNPKEAAALSVLSDIMTDGIASRFSQSLQIKQKIAIGTGGWYYSTTRDATGFGLYAVPAKGRSLADLEKAMDAEIAKMIKEGPTAEELTRVKRVMRANRIFAQDSQASLARLYGRVLAVGLTVKDVQDWAGHIDAVTAEDVKNAAAKHFDIRRSVTGWLTRNGKGN